MSTKYLRFRQDILITLAIGIIVTSYCLIPCKAIAHSFVEGKVAYRAAAYKLLYEKSKTAMQQSNRNEGKVQEHELQETVIAMTNCFMESMARYPEKYQTIAYDLAINGGSYLEANNAMEAALQVDMAADDTAGRALRQKVLENVNYARDCITNIEKSKKQPKEKQGK